MPHPSVLIIGAGIGGLSTGCHLQEGGAQTRILEMSGAAGGQCAAWSRQGYVFDGCVHNLAGTSPRSPFHALWAELGVTEAVAMRPYAELVSIERPGGGEPFVVPAKLDALETEMKRLFPEDAREIEGLVAAARRFAKHDMMGLAVEGPMERLGAILAHLPDLAGLAGQSMARFAERFKNPFLRYAFPRLIYDWPDQTMAVLLTFLAGLDKGDLGWPVGGSGALARAIEARFRAAGGHIRFHARVGAILVEDDRAVGVRLTDGSEERADIIVSNAYGPATIFGMLGGRYINKAIQEHYERPEVEVAMGLQVGLGVARNLADEPHAILLPLAAPVRIGGVSHERLYVQTFGFEPSFAPPGKSVIKALLPTSWLYWRNLYDDPVAYQAEKDAAAKAVIGCLAKRFAGLESQVEVVDVSTPMTMERFTGNGLGYSGSSAEMTMALLTGRRLSMTLPGLKNFYMVGQWAGMPGLSMVAAMGRDVARHILRHARAHA